MQPKPRLSPALRRDKETRSRRKPTRYDPTFHDEVPKFLQREGTRKKKKKRSQPEPDDSNDGIDVTCVLSCLL